jgi:hypothetical protein
MTEHGAQIERLVRWIARDFEDGEEIALARDADAMRRLREIAADVHRRWNADRSAGAKVALPNVRVAGETYDYEIELDGGDLDRIFGGTTASARGNSGAFVRVVTFCGVLVSLMVGLALLERHEHRQKNDANKEAANIKAGHAGDKLTGQEMAAPDPTTETPVPIDPGSAVVSSCTCNTPSDRFMLMASERNGGSWYVIRSSLLFSINAGDSGVLPSSASALHAAIGCDGDVVALVSGKVAAAWSMTGSGAPQWTRKLPAAVANAPQSMGCSDLLVRDGRMNVPLANGKTISLSMRNGALD